MSRRVRVRKVGWLDPDLFDPYCLACAPTRGAARRAAGLEEDDERMALVPVGIDWAIRSEMTCVVCGRRLSED